MAGSSGWLKNHPDMRFTLLLLSVVPLLLSAQLGWKEVTHTFGELPSSIQVYRTDNLLDGKPNIAYFVIADLKDQRLDFRADTTFQRRLTPEQFHLKLKAPLVILNTSFFSFTTHQNLNMMMDRGEMLAYNVHTIPGKGNDSLKYRHPLVGAIGISKDRKADVVWTYTDSTSRWPYSSQTVMPLLKNQQPTFPRDSVQVTLQKWKMHTAVSGGPVLVQNGIIQVTNNEEWKFAGKAIDDRHPRSAIGYRADGKLVLLAVEGRNTGKAEGATLKQTAMMLLSAGCVEGLNLDGGGSTCLLVNGKDTVRPSDREGQRAVPGVFYIRKRN